MTRRKPNEWKEYIFFATACVLYLVMATLLMVVQADVMLKLVLAVGLVINHVVLGIIVFKYDIDGKTSCNRVKDGNSGPQKSEG